MFLRVRDRIGIRDRDRVRAGCGFGFVCSISSVLELKICPSRKNKCTGLNSLTLPQIHMAVLYGF